MQDALGNLYLCKTMRMSKVFKDVLVNKKHKVNVIYCRLCRIINNSKDKEVDVEKLEHKMKKE